MKKRYVKTNKENFVRDTKTNAIINTDVVAFEAYKRERDRILKADALAEEVDSIKNEIYDIKNLLQQILNK